MSGNAPAFAAGHAAGFSAAQATVNGSTTLQSVATADARIVVHTVEEFFAEFLPNIGLMLLILAAFIVISWLIIAVVGFLLKQCGAHDHVKRLTQYMLMLLFTFLAFATAFGAVGVDFGQLLLAFGIVGGALMVAASPLISNMTAGIALQTHSLFEGHRSVKLIDHGGLQGEIRNMNLLHVEIAPYTQKTISAMDAGNIEDRQFVDRTVLVPNVVLNGTLVEVEWHKTRENTHPANSSVSGEEAYKRRRANAAASQASALGNSRFAAGYANTAMQQEPAPSAYPTSLLEKAQQAMAQRQHSAVPSQPSQWFDGLDMSEKDR